MGRGHSVQPETTTACSRARLGKGAAAFDGDGPDKNSNRDRKGAVLSVISQEVFVHA
jgi:hypothetical protein